MLGRWPRHRIQRVVVGSRAIAVYLRNDRLGKGPCMSVHQHAREVARFDLFDPAHMHVVDAVGSPRRPYPAGLAHEQYVEMAIADLSDLVPALKNYASWIREAFKALATDDTVAVMALSKSKPKKHVPQITTGTFRVRDRYVAGQKEPLVLWGTNLDFADAQFLTNKILGERKSTSARLESESIPLPDCEVEHRYSPTADAVAQPEPNLAPVTEPEYDPELERMRKQAKDASRVAADAANVRAELVAKQKAFDAALLAKAEATKAALRAGDGNADEIAELDGLAVSDDEIPNLNDVMDGVGGDMPSPDELAAAAATSPPATGNHA